MTRELPDVAALEARDERRLLAGEVELARRRASAVAHDGFSLFVGWVPEPELPALQSRVEAHHASLVELRRPRGQQPPTLLASRPVADAFRPLVDTYGAVPYRDLDPTAFVAVSYCLMFGMMFGDVGDGLLIVFAALALRQTRGPRWQRLRGVWPMIAAPGAAAVAFGALYGEFFGPTHIIPALWLSPLDQPTRLLAVALIAGGVLLAAGYAIGIVNRWREGGAAIALTAPSGVPGMMLLAAGGLVAAGVAAGSAAIEIAGVVIAGLALVPLLVGLRAGSTGGAIGIFEVAIGVLDAVVRLFSNVFSFARLAAFGLMHAAIGQVIFHAAGGLTGTAAGDILAALVFVSGRGVAFALEGLVVAVQALRLEYYELFSRLFTGDGRPFRPFRLPLLPTEESR